MIFIFYFKFKNRVLKINLKIVLQMSHTFSLQTIDLTNSSDDECEEEEVVFLVIYRPMQTEYEKAKAQELGKKTPQRMLTAIKAMYLPV